MKLRIVVYNTDNSVHDIYETEITYTSKNKFSADTQWIMNKAVEFANLGYRVEIETTKHI